jgi:hypothetical protein
LPFLFCPYILALYLDLILVKKFLHYIFILSGAVFVPQYLKTAQAVLVIINIYFYLYVHFLGRFFEYLCSTFKDLLFPLIANLFLITLLSCHLYSKWFLQLSRINLYCSYSSIPQTYLVESIPVHKLSTRKKINIYFTILLFNSFESKT